MSQDRAMRPWGFRRLSIASVILVSLALNAALLWKWFGRQEDSGRAPAVMAPKEERLEGPSLSPPPLEPRSTEGAPERPHSQDVQPLRDGEDRAIRGGEGGARVTERDLSLPAMVEVRTNAQPHEPLEPSSPGGAESTNGTTTATVAAVAAISGSGGLAVPSSGEVVTRPESPDESSEARSEPEAETPAEVEPGSDHTPPVLQALRFDPPVVEDGGVTTLTVQASDDLSGVKSVTGEIRSPNGRALLPFASGDASRGDARTFAITIPREAESGVWYVSWISLTDGAANPLLLQARSAANAPSGGTLTVNSLASDSAAPEVLQIWFDQTTVAGGEKNVIRVEARDDRSGVGSIMGACQSRSKSALIWFECALNEESGAWVGDIPIPTNAECGEWDLSQLAVKDKAGNTNLLVGDSVLLARAGFQVAFRPDCDSSPPTLEAFDLSPTIVSNETAAEILVTATVYDEGSGAVKMTGWFEGPVSSGGQVPKNYFQCSPDPNDPGAPWSGMIRVPRHAAKGTWKVGAIRLQDKALNVRDYTAADPEVSGSAFQVQ